MRMNGIGNHSEFAESNFTATNIIMLREKIISTDQLIRNYSAEREANEKRVDEVNKLQRSVEHLNKVCMKYENQLSESLRELQPCKESIKQLQEENNKHLEQIRELENKLAAGEKLTQQYEALLKSKEEQKDKNFVEKDEMDKQVGKKEKEIKAMKERIAKINEKLHDRVSRSQKLVKCYKTSVKHLLQFGKKLAKQENASKVDQKIIDHYRSIISKVKNSNEPDDNELDISELCEEAYVENSDSSFELVEENIISSPYKRRKAEINEVPCSPASKHKQISKNLDAEFSREVLQLNNSSLKVEPQCIETEQIENVEVACGMPVIDESDIQPQIKDVNSEKSDMLNNSDIHVLQNEVSSEYSEISNNKRIDSRKIEHCNKEDSLSRTGKSQDEALLINQLNQLSDDTPYNELEEEIARITFDMCSQGMPFHPLSPIPPTPPPGHVKNENSASFDEGIACYKSPRKEKRQPLDFSNVNKTSMFDGAMEHTNGMQKLCHQHSEGFEVLSDEMNSVTPNDNGRYSQPSQHNI